jgi:hypothetical protein
VLATTPKHSAAAACVAAAACLAAVAVALDVVAEERRAGRCTKRPNVARPDADQLATRRLQLLFSARRRQASERVPLSLGSKAKPLPSAFDDKYDVGPLIEAYFRAKELEMTQAEAVNRLKNIKQQIDNSLASPSTINWVQLLQEILAALAAILPFLSPSAAPGQTKP